VSTIVAAAKNAADAKISRREGIRGLYDYRAM